MSNKINNKNPNRRSAIAMSCKRKNGSGAMRHKNDRRMKDARRSFKNQQEW